MSTPLVVPFTSVVQGEITALAASIGEETSRIRVQDAQWSRFLQEGTTVDLHVGRWRAQVGITLADLGIVTESKADAAALERLISLGVRYLLPRSIIAESNNLESKARYALDKNSFKTFWGRWIHVSKYVEWRQDSDKIAEEYAALAVRIFNEWDALMDEVRRDYLSLGIQTYDRLLNNYLAQQRAWDTAFEGAPITTILDKNQGVPVRPEVPEPLRDRETWIASFVARCMAQIPSAASVRDSYTYSWDVKYIPLQQSVALDKANAERVERVNDEVVKIQAEILMADDIRRTQARESAEGMQRFVADIQAQVRTEVYLATVNALENLRDGGGKLQKNVTRQLKNLIETCTSMVFWEDGALAVRIESLRSVLDTPADKRSAEDVRNALQRLGAEARLVLLELQRVPERSGKAVGIPDDDILKLERVARRGLGKVREGRRFDVDDALLIERTPRQNREMELTGAL